MNLRHAVAPAFLVACILLGGASAAGYAANLVLQLIAIPIVCWGGWAVFRAPPTRSARLLLVLAALLAALLLLQLVPLPPSVWTALPGREGVAANYTLLGQSLPWLPLSLAPQRSVESLLWLLPAFAGLLSVAVLGAFRSSWIGWAILGVTAVSVGLGALQVAGGPGSSAYLYRITNYGYAVGFFANSNHAATLLVVAIPFIAALQAHARLRRRSSRQAHAIRILAFAGYAVIGIGLATNTSLAGIGLAVPVSLMTILWIGARRWSGGRWVPPLAAVASVATLAMILFGPFQNNLVGEQVTNPDLSRRTSFARTLAAAAEYAPVGSGVGTFLQVYRTQEPPEQATRTYMNHAHSDWIEIALETGLPGLLLAAAFVAWWIANVAAIRRMDPVDPFARAAAIATGAMMIHSLVDYPLRTAALSTLFAICAGLMSRVRPFVRQSRSGGGGARHLSV